MTDAIRQALRRLRALFGRTSKPAKWQSVGSPSYRRAIRDLAIGYPVRAIRRAAWRGRRALVLHNPAHCHDSNIKGWGWLHRQDDIHPPGHLIVQVSTDEFFGWRHREWWPAEAEDILADDWECCHQFGGWKPAIDGPDTI